MKNYKSLKFAFSAVLSFLILLFLFRKIDLYAVAERVSGSNLRLLMAALSLTVVARFILGSDRWKRILRFVGCNMPLWEAVVVKAGAAPIKFILPMKAGELLRAAYIANNKGLSFEAAVGSIVFDKTLGFLCIIIFVFSGFPFANLHVSKALLVTVFLAAAFVLLVGGMWRLPIGTAFRIHPKLGRSFSGLLSSFEMIPLMAKIKLVLYSLLIESSEIINSYIIFKSLGIGVPFFAILGLMPLRVFFSSLPITLSGIGATELSTVFLFSSYGSKETLLGAGIIISFVQYIFPALFGMILLGPFLARLSGSGGRSPLGREGIKARADGKRRCPAM